MDKSCRIFIDSNIWFSAFYKQSAASDLLEELLKTNFEIVICELVLEEIVRNIKTKLPSVLELARQFLLTYPLTIVKNPSLKQLSNYDGLADKKDLPILAAAINYNCQFLVTGNLKHFQIMKIGKKFGLQIINLKEAKKKLFS